MPRQEAETVLKNLEFFIYGDIYYVIISLCIKLLEIATLWTKM